MSVDNCKRCGRLFQRALHPMCPVCLEFIQKQKMAMFDFVQENPGVSIEEISQRFDISTKEIESMLFSGAFGTANQLIKTQCAKCKCEMTALNRVGYFCYSCNTRVEKEAGVRKPAEDDHIIGISTSPAASANLPPPASHSRRESKGSSFGFKRISN